ncbi:hypothetical protein [Planctomicrobium sp. SH527]|uniref:hypothetical protein n=1 Tax=Planctomicrobium sp. SH527 TaxID=3448123 RepID=UPI003F5CACB0
MTSRSIRIDANAIAYPMRPLLRALGLIRDISASDIQSVQSRRYFFLTEFQITFLDEDRQEKTIALVPWNAQRFQNGIEQLRSNRQHDEA